MNKMYICPSSGVCDFCKQCPHATDHEYDEYECSTDFCQTDGTKEIAIGGCKESRQAVQDEADRALGAAVRAEYVRMEADPHINMADIHIALWVEKVMRKAGLMK